MHTMINSSQMDYAGVILGSMMLKLCVCECGVLYSCIYNIVEYTFILSRIGLAQRARHLDLPWWVAQRVLFKNNCGRSIKIMGHILYLIMVLRVLPPIWVSVD